uniref:Uncharacterized protein n=1 Tax=Anguilla anguilla TaxID=7936 RepID=A0A0E9SMG2_ANGAN
MHMTITSTAPECQPFFFLQCVLVIHLMVVCLHTVCASIYIFTPQTFACVCRGLLHVTGQDSTVRTASLVGTAWAVKSEGRSADKTGLKGVSGLHFKLNNRL